MFASTPMANILLLDPNEMARRSMQGILARGNHRLAAVDTVQAAWEFIRRNVRVDLVIVELGLKEGSGLPLIERLKNDCLLKLLPVVVYTARGDRDAVKHGLELRVQNFLIKPYHDDAIFAEIAKAVSNPWCNRHFEEEKSFCKMMGYEPAMLQKMLEDLRSALEQARGPLRKWAELKAARPAGEALAPLAAQAEAAGAWGVVDCLKILDDHARADNWTAFELGMDTLEFAGRLIFQQLNPTLVPLDFLTVQEQHSESETRDRAVWFNAPAENRCPVASWPQLQGELDALAGCPIIDSAAASFQMAANGHPSCLNPLMDLVDRDPGLAAQMLIAANRARHPSENDPSAIEDPRLAVGLLGELRLAAQARGLVTAAERMMSLPPAFNWQQFWMFQIGTARMARYACQALELPDLAAPAYTAGLLHDLGKLLLLRLHPFALQATLEHARLNNLPLSDAERLYLGCTTHEIAVHFAEKQGLPGRFVNVMRWIHAPSEATADQELVAVVSLARDLCRHNQVGASGDKPVDEALPLEDTEEWSVLRQSVFPSFNLRNFELQVHSECRELKLELHGRLTSYAVA
jgi:CheY-like chemotaxis protein/HD-like signal output (HDOD) protein